MYCAVTNLASRCDTIWADTAEIIIMASRCLSHAKINSPESNAYLITSGWSSQPIGDKIWYFFLFPSRYYTLCIYLISRPAESYHLFLARAEIQKFLLPSFILFISYRHNFLKYMFENVSHLNFSFYIFGLKSSGADRPGGSIRPKSLCQKCQTIQFFFVTSANLDCSY